MFDYNNQNSPNDSSAKSDKINERPSNNSAVHYDPDQADGDQIHQEALVRGDDSPSSALHADQPDQFYHNEQSRISSTNSNFRPTVQVSNRGHAYTNEQQRKQANRYRSNEQRLIDLYSVKGGVAEVQHPALSRQLQQLQLNPNNIHQRARVISVTPAPDHEAQYEASERSQIRRVVVSKPIQRELLPPAAPQVYGQRLRVKQTRAHRAQNRPVYITPVPHNVAHLRSN